MTYVPQSSESYSQGLSNNYKPEPNQPYFFNIYSNIVDLRLGLPIGLFSAGIHIKFLKYFKPSSIQAKYPPFLTF